MSKQNKKDRDRDAALVAAYEERPISLHKLGQRFGISGQRVHQIFDRMGYTNRYKRSEINRVSVTCPCGNEVRITHKAAEKFTYCSGRCKYRIENKDTHEKRRKAYELRKQGLRWKTISGMLGYKNPETTCNEAKYHARWHKLPWPLYRHGDHGTAFGSRVREAYVLRKEGRSWLAIAHKLNYRSREAAYNSTRQHALRHDLEWPVNVSKDNNNES